MVIANIGAVKDVTGEKQMDDKKWQSYIKEFTGGYDQGILENPVSAGNHLGIGLEFFEGQNIDAKNKKFLDIGCCDGALKKHIKSEWYGMDIFEQSIENYKKADLHELPYADNEFDILFCNHVLEHVLAPYICIQEMKRVVKTGGSVIVGVPVLPYFKCSEHIYLLTEEAWEWLLGMAGFGMVTKQNFKHSVMFHCKKLKDTEQ